jgi:predicted permease
MFKTFFKIAWRNLLKRKVFTTINILGLAIGITCSGLILLWVEDEVNYDGVFPKQDLIYYVPTNQKFEGELYTFYSTPGPLAEDLKEEIPEITKAAISWSGEILIANGDTGINRRGRYADPDFLDIFSLKFVEGDVKNALNRPDAIVLTQRTAAAIFGESTEALHRVLRVDNKYNFTVTGVVENLPDNVTFDFDWLLPFERFQLGEEDMSWAEEYGNNFADTFVELAPNADFEAVDAKVRALIPSKMKDLDISPNQAFLHTIRDWHLRSAFRNGKKVGGQVTLVRMVGLIGFIILLIACINFMNLSTARSEKRAKEVGIRKVLGSGKKTLVSQFMAEAFITASLSAVLSIVMLLLLLPSFNTLVEKQLELRLYDINHLLSLIGITLVCGFLAGWYPALYLSSFRPVQVLKGLQRKQGHAALIRKGLVITQFSVSIIFIISTVIVYQQVQYARGRDLGYAKEQLVSIAVNGDIIKEFNPIKQDMIASGHIENVALSNSNMLSGGNNGAGLSWQGGSETEDILVRFRYVSPGFFETMGLTIIEGHGFNENKVADSTNILITESFAKLMGEGSAVGKTVTRNKTEYDIVGVVNDYIYGDVYGNDRSGPVMFYNHPEFGNTLYVKLKQEASVSEAISTIVKVMKQYNPAFPLDYRFENDIFNASFRNEELIGDLSKIFSILAIVISCLGLFGLSAFTAEQRKKEIGIRKVLGASISGIVQLLSNEIIRLLLVALVIAVPVSWWAMHLWLEKFTYRIAIDWRVFVVAGLAATFIALLTISYQSIRSAIANPVKSLRTE